MLPKIPSTGVSRVHGELATLLCRRQERGEVLCAKVDARHLECVGLQQDAEDLLHPIKSKVLIHRWSSLFQFLKQILAFQNEIRQHWDHKKIMQQSEALEGRDQEELDLQDDALAEAGIRNGGVFRIVIFRIVGEPWHIRNDKMGQSCPQPSERPQPRKAFLPSISNFCDRQCIGCRPRQAPAAALQEQDAESAGVLVRRVHRAVMSSLWWAYARMTFNILFAFERLASFAESCTCHCSIRAGHSWAEHRTLLKQLHVPLGSAEGLSCCMAGRRGPEFASGIARSSLLELQKQQASDLESVAGSLQAKVVAA